MVTEGGKGNNLQQQCALAHSRVTTNEDHGPWHHAPTQHPGQLSPTGALQG